MTAPARLYPPAVEAAVPLPPAAAATPPPLEWSWSPWRERPRRAAAALACTAGAGLLVAGVTHTALLAILLGLAVGGTLSPLIVPQRCRIDAGGVAVRGAFGWERRAWSEIRRARLEAGGVLVSPFARARRLDAFRSLYLPVPAAGRARLETAVRAHLLGHEL